MALAKPCRSGGSEKNIWSLEVDTEKPEEVQSLVAALFSLTAGFMLGQV